MKTHIEMDQGTDEYQEKDLVFFEKAPKGLHGMAKIGRILGRVECRDLVGESGGFCKVVSQRGIIYYWYLMNKTILLEVRCRGGMMREIIDLE
jgi:hypothetical protein